MKGQPVKAIIGNQELKIKSDCHIEMELCSTGGLQIQIQSKVNALFGRSIHQLFYEILNFYKIKHAKVNLIDTGALPLVLAARLDALLKN